MKNVHECEVLERSKVAITIEKINNDWLWIYFDKKGNTAHGIKYCPYCGEELK